MVAHCRLVLANLLRLSVNFPTKRGRGKNGKEKERKKKGGAPRAPTPPKGGEDSRRGRRGGESKNTFRSGQNAHAGFCTRGIATMHLSIASMPYQRRVSELPLDLAPSLPDIGRKETDAG